MTLLAPDTYTGATAVMGGTLTLSNDNSSAAGTVTVSGAAVNGAFTAGALVLNNFGTLGTGAVAIDQSGTLTLDNTSINVSGRFTNSTNPSLTFNSGNLTFLANNTAGVASSETVGTITLASGQSVINSGFATAPYSGATSVLTSAALVRSAGATVNFVGGTGNVSPLGTTTNQIQFTTAPSGSLLFTGNQGTILPFAEVGGGGNSGDFTTYGSKGIAPFTNYLLQNVTTATATLSGGSGDIVKVTAAITTTITGGFLQTIGALLFVNTNTSTTAANVQINPNGLLTVSSGALMTVGGTSAGNTVSLGTGTGSAFFLPTETVLFQNNSGSGNTNFNGPIIGSGSLVIAGGNGIFLSTTSNTFSGGAILNAGTLIVQGSRQPRQRHADPHRRNVSEQHRQPHL